MDNIILIFILILCAVIYMRTIKITTLIPDNGMPQSSKQVFVKKKEDYKKYTVKMVIRWEQLTKKPFHQMDYSSKNDIDALIYVMSVDNTPYTFEVFKEAVTNDKIFKDLMRSIEKSMAIMAQFQKEGSVGDGRDSSSGTCSIGEIVSMLVMDGLSAHYAMEEMELCDLPLYIDAYEKRRKESMESSRLWTYITILPHIDGKKVPSPQSLYPFPWEEAEMKKVAEKEIKDNEETFRKFFSGELFDLDKVNWKNKN